MAFNILYVNQPILAQQQRSSFITCPVPSCDEKWFQSICLGWGISQGAARTATKVMWQVIKESCANQLLLVEDHFTLSRNIISTPRIIFPLCGQCIISIFQWIYIQSQADIPIAGTSFDRKAGILYLNFCDEKQKGIGTFSIAYQNVSSCPCVSFLRFNKKVLVTDEEWLQSEFRS